MFPIDTEIETLFSRETLSLRERRPYVVVDFAGMEAVFDLEKLTEVKAWLDEAVTTLSSHDDNCADCCEKG
jgi:hypothetical protein